MKITKKLSDRLEALLTQAGYKIRYEKGNFKGGVCVLLEQKLIIVNKFYPFDSRVSTLMDVVLQTEAFNDFQKFDDDDRKLIQNLKNYFKKESNLLFTNTDASDKDKPANNPSYAEATVIQDLPHFEDTNQAAV